MKIRSNAEKEIYMMMKREPMPELPYELKVHHTEEFGDEHYYEIPEEDKQKVLDDLWPFMEKPALNSKCYDIHEEKVVNVKDYFVIRFNERNMIVSPCYFTSGGTVLDMALSIRKAKRVGSDYFVTVVSKIKNFK